MSFNPLLSKAVTNKAVSLAQQAMQNDAVRKQLKEAPETVGRWAKSLQQSNAAGGGALANLAKLDPTARYSEPALERRLDALAENVAVVFDDAEHPVRKSTKQAIHEFRRALIIASPLPLLKRKKVYFRIDAEIGTLEQALVDAVLSPSGDDAETETDPDVASDVTSDDA